MSIIAWKGLYETGNREVDLQHQYFCELINRIGNRLSGASDLLYKERLLKELSRYASFHFISEENIIYYARLEGLVEHQTMHMQLLNDLKVKIELLKNGETGSSDIVQFITDWFVDHTTKEDLKIFGKL